MKSHVKRTIVIAEAGVNHNGSLDIAKELVDAAAEAGADYVKFQTFRTESLLVKDASMAEYQKRNLGLRSGSQYEMLKKLELNKSDHFELIEYCSQRGIKFLSTAFDLDSVNFLKSLNLDYWKIPSGEITNYPYLRAIAQYSGKVIMSTGMCTLDDINNALSVLTRFGTERHNITLLHCNTGYPTPMADVNLRAMVEMKSIFGTGVGYSDHTVGIEIPVAAVALGAEIIEKHFTLSHRMSGPDHVASLEPDELKSMVKSIRNIELALGSGAKDITGSERNNIEAARKSIVASRRIKMGETFDDNNLCAKRPGSGISPMRWEEVVGRKATRDYDPDEPIEIPPL